MRAGNFQSKEELKMGTLAITNIGTLVSGDLEKAFYGRIR